MVLGGGSLARRWGWSFLGCGTSVGEMACGSSSPSSALLGGTSVGEMYCGSSSLLRALFGGYFLGISGSWFLLTLEGLVYNLHTVGDEVHIGGNLVEDLHIVGTVSQVASNWCLKSSTCQFGKGIPEARNPLVDRRRPLKTRHGRPP